MIDASRERPNSPPRESHAQTFLGSGMKPEAFAKGVVLNKTVAPIPG